MVRKGRRVRGVMVAGLVLGGFFATGSPVQADAPGVGFGGPYADNAEHYYFHVDLEPETRDAVNWALTNALDPPSQLKPKPDESLGENTDVVSYDHDYTAWTPPDEEEQICWDCEWNVYGLTWCASREGTNYPSQCQKFEVRYDLSDFSPAYGGWMNDNQRRYIACHELGHTVGFDDPVEEGPQDTGSCTRYYWGGISSSPVRYYGDHDQGHMVDRYGHPPGGGGTPTYQGVCDTVKGANDLVLGLPGSEVAAAQTAIQECA